MALNRVFVLAVAFALGLYHNDSLAEHGYSWPLKIPIELTSKFGDFRGGHWHAGIDLRTQGRTGLKVYAIGDGYIFKIRTSFWGYGKSLYLKLADGNMAVYGHLEKYTPELDRRLKKTQMSTRNYFQEIVFAPNEYPVKKGDLIAFSGQSGVGYPHLHLETRDKDNYPINPLNYFSPLDDNRPPVIRYIAIKRYFTYGVNNYHDWELIEVASAGGPTIKDTLIVYGNFVFSVCAFDPGNGFSFGIDKAALFLDDREIFSFHRDTLDYTTGNQIGYVNDMEMNGYLKESKMQAADQDKNVFYRLYVQPKDRQRFYEPYAYPAGIIDGEGLGDGVHRCRIRVNDFAGNVSSKEFYIRRSNLVTPKPVSIKRSGKEVALFFESFPPASTIRLQYRFDRARPFIDLACTVDRSSRCIRFSEQAHGATYRFRMVSSDGGSSDWFYFVVDKANNVITPFADYLQIVADRSQGLSLNGVDLSDERFGLLRSDEGLIQGLIAISDRNVPVRLTDADGKVVFASWVVKNDAIIWSPDSLLSLSISSRNLYGPSAMVLTDPVKKGDRYFFSLKPIDLIFDGKVELTLKTVIPLSIVNKSGIYRVNESGQPESFVGKIDSLRTVFSINSGGLFAIIADLNPPLISRLSPARGSQVRSRVPQISCNVTDDLSGFSRESQLEMKIDGNWVPADYDITTKSYKYQIESPLRPGEHSVTVRATDNQGNSATATWKFVILGKY